ncbi:hypothetical protein [Streptomyces californicus]|uniref:hypothetical protein n=1 Tax=Streptomyces californicus TaxID=67351 RepID=UPI0030B8C317
MGPHFCVGSRVARIALRILFEELRTRFEDFQRVGRPERLAYAFVSGWKHMPVTARPRARANGLPDRGITGRG